MESSRSSLVRRHLPNCFIEWLRSNRTIVTDLFQRTEERFDVDHARGRGKLAFIIHLLVNRNPRQARR